MMGEARWQTLELESPYCEEEQWQALELERPYCEEAQWQALGEELRDYICNCNQETEQTGRGFRI